MGVSPVAEASPMGSRGIRENSEQECLWGPYILNNRVPCLLYRGLGSSFSYVSTRSSKFH